MEFVSRLLVVVALFAVACTGTTVATTEPAPTTLPATPTSTTAPTLDIVMQGCASPPVTFSPLCEVFELLDIWYVDAPVDVEALAGVALRGLEEFTTDATEEPPRTLFCSLPDASFAPFCEELAEQVADSQIPVGEAVEWAVAHMVEVGLDPFTFYVPPEQAGSIRANGIVGGIGVVLDARDVAGSKCTQVSATCTLEIVVVLEDNPGFDAGLSAGDVIVSVDGEPVDGRGFTSIVADVAGDETGQVDLGVLRDGENLAFSIERSELTVPTVEYAVPRNDVGYISIPDFEWDIPELVSDSLDEVMAEDPDVLVVDLRDNPGGFVDAVVAVADMFIDGGVIMVTEEPDETLEYPAAGGGIAADPRLIVLVNKGTASAAEVLAASLRDRRGAIVLGTNTFGKDAVQIPFGLRNGGDFYVVVSRWSSPNGDTVGDGGLTPDREVSWPTDATVEDIIDLALEASS